MEPRFVSLKLQVERQWFGTICLDLLVTYGELIDSLRGVQIRLGLQWEAKADR